ncbi:vWA domain-containing protein [Robertkochia flava]|uniref:vWA domain-containing protein n=1 Tax=Robertkochia flava TaxID=3447986 RepID=UPI001CCB851D|nr:vWA domain-containing protein [Robertkochia marina]
MNGTTYLLIITSFILSFTIAYLWYRDGMSRGRVFLLFFVLRGLALWGLALLLINPVIRKYTLVTEKPSLNILVDNSASMAYLEDPESIKQGLETLQNDKDIREMFDVRTYLFDQELYTTDTTPGFNGGKTNIARAFQRLKNLEGPERSATVLISDGNSTYGGDYQYNSSGISGPVYTLSVGDTTTYEDLFIERINVNRYAYLNNKFPVEVFVGYDGQNKTTAEVEILGNNRVLARKRITIEPGVARPAEHFELEAEASGVKKFKVSISELPVEKNTDNNRSTFAVEVIDQRNRIALVSEIMHPDLGSLKHILESSNQRSVEILSPAQVENATEFDLYILYQPGDSFTSLFKTLEEGKINYWLIGGEATDWRVVNENQNVFTREVTYTAEEVTGQLNPGFGAFQAVDPGVEGYPPLNSLLGDFILHGAFETLIYKTISGIYADRPLLFTSETNEQRIAVLDATGIWKWRLWHYNQNESFESYDEYWNKLIQFLSSGIKKERLSVSYDPLYYANSTVRLIAGYYDKNFEFDAGERLELALKHQDSSRVRSIPFRAGENNYEAVLSGLPPGQYDFSIRVPSQNLSRSGQFTVLEYEVEKQFVNTDDSRMKHLAEITGGKMTRLGMLPQLIEELKSNTALKPVQKRRENIVPLLEWQWLLFTIALLFAIEWFTRKYNGLI